MTVPSWTWHQFRADAGEPLGFLCLVRADRDRPRLPDYDTGARLTALLHQGRAYDEEGAAR